MAFAPQFVLPKLSSLSSRSAVPVVLQSEAAECGLTCVNMVARFYGDKRDLNHLRQHISVSLRGVTLKDIMDIASQLGFQSRALKVEVSHLSQLKLPAILHWDMRHFVVLTDVKRNSIVINDPTIGKCTFSMSEASKHVTGIALEVFPQDNFSPATAPPLLKLKDFFSRTTGFKRNLVTLLFLSALIQFFSLASPYYIQTIVDDVILQGNQTLLTTLAIGFSLLLIIETFTNVLRRLLILSVSTRLQLQMSASVFQHLISLPLDFFSKRHVGDVVSRFGSLTHIREFLTTGMVTALLDGFMALVTLIVMGIYSLKLTLVVVLFVTLYVVIRLGLLPIAKRLTAEKIALAATEQSHFMESVRGMLPIRIYHQEVQRHSQWQNKLVNTLNKDISLGKLNIGNEATNQFLFGIENVIVIFIAASLVIDNALTVGMMLAFIAYKARFTSAVDGIVNQVIALKMLSLHFSRLSDIVLTKPIPTLNGGKLPTQHYQPPSVESPTIHLDALNISYRYGKGCPLVLDSINLSVDMGQIIAIVGPSGSGKSTFIKCLMGLYPLESGTVTLHGSSTKSTPAIAAVLQEDMCLSGTLAENISCFEASPNHQALIQASKMACIHDEICAMPMQYHTLVGDMGSSLSGGQQQRVLLARALYQSPDILFLDEASSHLDTVNEQAINHHLKSLNITRIIVAHRPQTIGLADVIYQLTNGKLKRCTRSEALGKAAYSNNGVMQ